MSSRLCCKLPAPFTRRKIALDCFRFPRILVSSIHSGSPTFSSLANFIIVQLIELAIGLRPKYFLDPTNYTSLILDYGFDRYGLSQDLCVLYL